MGEYAIRKTDNQEIKIGTCGDMYYLRYEDRDKVQSLEGNVDTHDPDAVKQLRFRLPFPDEDHIKPGEYEPFRGATLYNFSNPETVDDPGILQVHSKTGMLMNVTCYHGEKLPEKTKDVTFFWNGKGPVYNLTALKFVDGVVYGIYTCIECGHAWRRPLKELLPFMGADNVDLRARLVEEYVPDYKEAPQ